MNITFGKYYQYVKFLRLLIVSELGQLQLVSYKTMYDEAVPYLWCVVFQYDGQEEAIVNPYLQGDKLSSVAKKGVMMK